MCELSKEELHSGELKRRSPNTLMGLVTEAAAPCVPLCQLKFKTHFLSPWKWNNWTFLCLSFLFCLRRITAPPISYGGCEDWDYMWKKSLGECPVCGKYPVSSRPLLQLHWKPEGVSHLARLTPASPLVSSSYSWQWHSSSCSGQSPWVICDSFLSLTPKALGSFFKIYPELDCRYPGPSHHCLLPDYWNLLSGLSASVFEPIQSVLNVATKIMLLKCKSDHTKTLCSKLVQWLPVLHGIKTKFPTNHPGGFKWPAISCSTCLTSSPWPSLATLASSSNLEEHSCFRAFALTVPSAKPSIPQVPAWLALSLPSGLYRVTASVISSLET